MTMSSKYDIKDKLLAAKGRERIAWAGRDMPVLKMIRERFAKEKPFSGMRVSGCLHVTTETANLVIALQAGGADVVLCASNPLSTQDDVAAALVEYGIATYAIKAEPQDRYYQHINNALDHQPDFTMDDGADLVSTLHSKRGDVIANVKGGTEETTTGVIRLHSMAKAGKLKYPVIAVNDALTKHLYDNRYGTGQSTIDGITRATNILWAGRQVVVIGYGWCARGIAMRAKGLGANVIVCEVNPFRALEALMDGFRVMPILQAAKIGDVFISSTGDKNVIDRDHLMRMKDGAIMANSGHFNVEINIPALESMADSKKQIRTFVTDYQMPDGRHLYLLADGRLVNLSAAEGHPASVMDMSFADQALSVEYMAKNIGKLEARVYNVPDDIDENVARLKLESLGIKIDTLTPEQEKYLASWEYGT